ncbi:hypothetical protein BDW02DRAFT_184873 [Decorospora gaudefroyi]|uniref:Developmental regulatory protein wetA n=1 Tax=Decorospora gaudefroyi TaxID=184978 RepID=A0A6A5K457_9PLEO|nr:hypothetical protein BDW02DRAFT_184873 [Decorospora gaudefroyi]
MTLLPQHYPTDTIPMRPISDKEMDPVDLERLFEEYLETDLLNHFSDSTADQSSPDDLAHLFELPSSNESELLAEPLPDRDMQNAWHKALEKREQQIPTSSVPDDCTSSFYVTSPTGKDSYSDSELLSFEDLFELERNQLRTISQPSTPRPHTSGRSVKKAVSFHNQLTHRGISKSMKRSPAAPFAKMMQPSYYRSSIPDVWNRKTETPSDSFVRASSHRIMSPPPSIKLIHQENGNGFFAQNHHHAYTNNRSPLDEPDFSNYQLTPTASPAIGTTHSNDNGYEQNVGLAFSSSSASSGALSALQTPPSSLQLPMTTWGPETSPGLDFSFSASSDFSTGTKTAGWWDDEVPTTHYRESSSRCTSQNLGLEGLGISCNSSSFDFGTMGDNAGASASFNTGISQYTPTPTSNSTTMYPTPPRHTQHMVPIGHPISRTPSPSPHPRLHRRRPSHPHQTTTTSSQRRKSSNSNHSPGGGGAGFVNFTPDDSRKILTGVAPSGSSKTKARREKEAADKRRKLSQAAFKAVLDAGGDVDFVKRLEREGVFLEG